MQEDWVLWEFLEGKLVIDFKEQQLVKWEENQECGIIEDERKVF